MHKPWCNNYSVTQTHLYKSSLIPAVCRTNVKMCFKPKLNYDCIRVLILLSCKLGTCFLFELALRRLSDLILMTCGKNEQGHLHARDDNMFTPANIDSGFSQSLSRHGISPALLTCTPLFFNTFLFTFLPRWFSLTLSLTLICSGWYISIMQPLPASEEERIRPTLPSVVACQPCTYCGGSHQTAATLPPHIGICIDRILINGKHGTHNKWTS